MKESYSIKITRRSLLGSEYLTGYVSRAEAERVLELTEKEPGNTYEVVYVREYEEKVYWDGYYIPMMKYDEISDKFKLVKGKEEYVVILKNLAESGKLARIVYLSRGPVDCYIKEYSDLHEFPDKSIEPGILIDEFIKFKKEFWESSEDCLQERHVQIKNISELYITS